MVVGFNGRAFLVRGTVGVILPQGQSDDGGPDERAGLPVKQPSSQLALLGLLAPMRRCRLRGSRRHYALGQTAPVTFGRRGVCAIACLSQEHRYLSKVPLSLDSPIGIAY